MIHMDISARHFSLESWSTHGTPSVLSGTLFSFITGFLLLFSPLSHAAEILAGAGATFPKPLYEKWITVYQEKTGIRISYKGVGSGEGIQALLKREVDFGATDIFLSDEQLVNEKSAVLHIPTCIGAVGIIYNLPGNPELKLNPEILTDIFLGRIVTWSAKEIQEVNPGKPLPNLPIAVVHRSEKSGTNYALTDYFSKVSPRWSSEIGTGTKVKWKTGGSILSSPTRPCPT
jgi:phosphate transport system substrate-binding protein